MKKNGIQRRVTTNPRILIGTLYCGENEYTQCLDMLHRQTYTHWEQVVFRDLGNKEAHDNLYRYFVSHRRDFDLFLKLDADMVFRVTDSLERLVELFKSVANVDHLQTPVLDWYSGLLLPALHVYSNRVTWGENSDELFVDPFPTIPGKRMSWSDEPAPFVYHSPNPSPKQAFLFGVHRAVKALQPERRMFNRAQGMFQWKVLKAVWERFAETLDYRLGLCLYGAELVFQGKLTHLDYVDGKRGVVQYSNLSSKELVRMLTRRWGNTLYRKRGTSG